MSSASSACFRPMTAPRRSAARWPRTRARRRVRPSRARVTHRRTGDRTVMSASCRLVYRCIAVFVAVFLLPAFAHAKAGDAIGSHTAKVNGVEIHYLAAGSGDKTPVILLHGYAETGHMWLPLIPKIDDGRSVIAPDLRGIGGS